MTFVDDISRELEGQATFLKSREPVYGRLLPLLENEVRGAFGERLQEIWADRVFHSPYERPLMLLAALRYDALLEGPAHPLHAALASDQPRLGTVTPGALAAAISTAHVRFERALRERSVQTNETTRAIAWLWPACLLHAAGERRPVALVDLGTSAGLNLIADRLPALWVDEHDQPIPVSPRPPLARRLGLDRTPLDVHQDDDATWLRACVWPSDRERLGRLDAAIASFRACSAGPDAPALETLSLADASARLRAVPADEFVLCVQTIVRDYLAQSDRERYETGLRAFLRERPRSSLLAELEVNLADLDVADQSAVLTVSFAETSGEIRDLVLARTHPHPRRLFRNPEAIEAFSAAFAR